MPAFLTLALVLIFIYIFSHIKSHYKVASANTEKTEQKIVVEWGKCLSFGRAPPWCLMLGKSSLRKNQSRCRLCLFGALEVSIALGHETYRIYTGYKEGGFYNAWWST